MEKEKDNKLNSLGLMIQKDQEKFKCQLEASHSTNVNATATDG
jgi:hypothetical protein